jgi:hypothetical protein
LFIDCCDNKPLSFFTLSQEEWDHTDIAEDEERELTRGIDSRYKSNKDLASFLQSHAKFLELRNSYSECELWMKSIDFLVILL